jgi:GAF domain-containing protein
MEKNNKAAPILPKLSDVLSAIDKAVLEMISSGAPLSDVLTVMSQIIEEQSPGLHCSILLLDTDRKSLRHGAAPSLPESYISAIEGIAIGPRVGSCGTAAYRAEPVIVTDIATDPLWSDYRDLARRHGLRACWSIPIISKDGNVLGTFAMYYREPRSPSREDLQVIERATHLAAIAIERQRAEAEQQVMSEIIQGVNASANLDELFRLVHQLLKKVLFAENFFVALYDRRSEHVIPNKAPEH